MAFKQSKNIIYNVTLCLRLVKNCVIQNFISTAVGESKYSWFSIRKKFIFNGDLHPSSGSVN